jgi:polyisoprenoid-binding protein YceI
MIAMAIVAALFATTQQQDSVLYRFSHDSKFEVTTHKSGFFSFAGHEHVIRARAFAGRIIYVPSAPERSRFEIVVPTDSLEVLTPPDTAEIRKVTAAMRSDVLDVAHHPEIRFESKALTRTSDGFRVTGTLTLVGKSQLVTVDIKTTIRSDTLRASGGFDVLQTAFGIRPYHGGPGGLVRVADRVTFHFEVIGLSCGPSCAPAH